MRQAELIVQNNRLQLKGALNFASVMDLYVESLAHLLLHKEIIINLSQVTAANSAGLALMLEWLKYAKTHALTIQFEQIPASLLAIAKTANLETFIPIKK